MNAVLPLSTCSVRDGSRSIHGFIITVNNELTGFVNPAISQAQGSMWLVGTVPGVPTHRDDVLGLLRVQAKHEGRRVDRLENGRVMRIRGKCGVVL